MAFTVPNVGNAAFASQASLDSGDLAILASGAGITGVVSGCAVTAQASPNMTVAVTAGVARIGGKRAAVVAGNVTISAADVTNPRHDLITVDTTGALAAILGSPAAVTSNAEPVFAAIPAGRVVLASVYVPAGGTAVSSNQITDKRVVIADPGFENVVWYGADPTGVADSTTAFTLALAALPTVTVYSSPTIPGKPGSGGTGTSATYSVGAITLPAGTFRIGTSSDIGNLGPFVSVVGAGHTTCILDYRGAGDALRAYNAVRPAFDTFYTLNGMSGRFDGFTIGGDNAQAGAIGLHIGDGEGYVFGPDLYVRNFNLTGSRGILFDNQFAWTENIRGWATVYDCTTCVEFQAGNGATVQNGFTGGDNSFMYNDMTFKLYGRQQQNGVVLSQGATFQGGKLRIFANMENNTGATTNALLTITGQCPVGHLGAGTYSQLQRCDLHIHAETNGGGANKPQTINYGSVTGNAIYDCIGSLTFAGNWTLSNWTLAGSFALGNFRIAGVITGDTNLVLGDGFQTAAGLLYGRTTLFSDGGLPLITGDFADGVLTQDITVNFQQVQGGPQRKTIRIQQASSGGPYAVTWPVNVDWASGAVPTMSTTPSAYDLYFLESFDGTQWYGRVIQDPDGLGVKVLRTAGVNKDPGAATVTNYGMAAPTLTATATSADDTSGALVNHATTAVSGNASGMISAFTQTQRSWSPQMDCAVKTGVAADITTVRLQIGLFSASPDSAPGTIHGAYFRYDTGVDGTAFWRTCTAAGGTPTVTTTTVAVAAATRYQFTIVCSATAVLFYINRRPVAVHILTLPTTTTLLGYGIRVTTLSAAIRNLKWSWLQLVQV